MTPKRHSRIFIAASVPVIHLPSPTPRRCSSVSSSIRSVTTSAAWGRYKLNQKLTINVPLETRVITNDDIVAATQYVINPSPRRGERPTISIISAAVVSAQSANLLANQCRTGLSRTERLVKERMTLFDVNTEGMTPQKLINPEGALRRHPRLLRSQPAVPVHGSNQSAGRADAQAPVYPRLGQGACRAIAPALKSATCILPITDAFARSRRRKVRTSA